MLFGLYCQVFKSFHSVTGPKLEVVDTREIYDSGGILPKLGIHLVLCKTKEGRPIAGIPDPDHGAKNLHSQLVGGTHCIQIGPYQVATAGMLYACGVRQDLILKPDPMSDQLTRLFYSAGNLKQIMDNTPEGLDSFGTTFLMFLFGEACDAAQSAGLDVDRVARLHLAQTCLAMMKEYLDKTFGKKRAAELFIHSTTISNFHRTCNGVKAVDLGWKKSFPDEPRWPKASGSARLEHKFGNRRSQLNTFNVLDLTNFFMRDLV